MKHANFIASLLATPWAMRPEAMSAYAMAIAGKAAQEWAASAEGMAAAQAASASTASRSRQQGNIAVIPLLGPIMQRANLMEMCGGGTSIERFTAKFREAMADPAVDGVLIDIDSPGGGVYGVQELAEEIMAARSQKSITAIANSQAASAAYWIGCAAQEFYITPSGEAGSIGVWMAHEDWSKAMEEQGISTTLISAGKFKVEGNPYQPLGDEARSFMQSRVDDFYSAFVKGVAKGRDASVETVRSEMGQGRCLGASDAVKAGMCDGIATFDQVLGKMAKAKPRSALKAAQNRLAILG